jgi:CheY-like chemotaxis protein
VLVVDDSSTSFLLLEEMLANWSAEVAVVNRGKSVQDRLQNAALRGRPFDVVVLDHSLPDATTEELLRVIRLDPALAHAYVVLLSALDFDAHYEGTRVIAPDVCIGKPVRQQLMRTALRASREPRVPLTVPAPAAEARPPAERTLKANLGLHVMVVDDNAINREVSLAMLEELGCSVVLAEDGRPAVAHAQHDRFDVIFMDCQMPGMDGYAATEAIRRDEAQRGLKPAPIIALTANVMSRDRHRCEAAGMTGFLAKPFKGVQLLDLLQPIAQARGTFKPTAPDAAPAPAAAAAPVPAPVAPPVVATALAEPAGRANVADTLAPVPAEALAEACSPDEAQVPAAPEALAVAAVLDSPPASIAPVSRLPVLDLEQVQSIRGLGKPMVFERLCEMLFASSKDAFARLDAALADANLEEVAAAAHALKSPVNNLGGRRLADLLERCETAALEGADIAVVRRSAAGLKAHYAALVAALQTETRRSTGTD